MAESNVANPNPDPPGSETFYLLGSGSVMTLPDPIPVSEIISEDQASLKKLQ